MKKKKYFAIIRLLFFKYFIGYLYDNYKVKPLHIILPKTTAYIKNYDGQSIWMYLLIKDDDLLEKYNTISDKLTADIKKQFDSEPVYNTNYLKTKIKYHGNEVTDFYEKKIPKLQSVTKYLRLTLVFM